MNEMVDNFLFHCIALLLVRTILVVSKILLVSGKGDLNE